MIMEYLQRNFDSEAIPSNDQFVIHGIRYVH